MAVNYSVIDSYKTTQVLGGTTVQDVQYMVIRTIPTGITLAYAMAYTTYQAGGPYTILEEISTLLEDLVTNSHVVAGSDVSDLDKDGLLTDYCDLIVELDQSAAGLPPLDGTVSIPVGIISLYASDPSIASQSGNPSPASLCDEEYKRLQTLAAG